MKMREVSPEFRGFFAAPMRGVGLIEVLIALLVLSVGILGIIGMQITGKQTNNDAVQRTTASQLAFDLIESMRANPTALKTYVDAGVIGAGNLAAPSGTSACDSAPNACSALDLVDADLYLWEQALIGQSEVRGGAATGGLVSPRACITGPGGPGMYELVLVWRGTQEQTPNDAALAAVCGGALNTTGLYDSAAPGTDNRHRRVLRISFYVAV